MSYSKLWRFYPSILHQKIPLYIICVHRCWVISFLPSTTDWSLFYISTFYFNLHYHEHTEKMYEVLTVGYTVSITHEALKIKTPPEEEIRCVLFTISTCSAMQGCPRGTCTEVMRTIMESPFVSGTYLFLHNNQPKTQPLKTAAISDFPDSIG